MEQTLLLSSLKPPLLLLLSSANLKMKRKAGPSKQSPYVSEWSYGVRGVGEQFKGKDETSVYGRFPFQASIRAGIFPIVAGAYIEFMHQRKGHKREHDKLSPMYNFEVATVNNKKWFCTLKKCGSPITDVHLDVIFYYLRKKEIFGLKVRMTTTDSNFDKVIQSLYMKTLSGGMNEEPAATTSSALEEDPFQIEYINLPLVQDVDYGPCVAVFAEYLIENAPLSNDLFCLEIYRERYAVLLWDYGRQKVENKEFSDCEDLVTVDERCQQKEAQWRNDVETLVLS